MAERVDQADKRRTDRPASERSAAEPKTTAARSDTAAGRTTATTARTSGIAAGMHALLRIGAGLLFMQHGVQKLFGWLGGEPVELISLMGLAGVLETFGGLLIVLGLFTQPIAVILVIEMIAAYFMAHFPQGGFPIENGGEPALLFAIIFAFLAANGPGPASIDRAMADRRRV